MRHGQPKSSSFSPRWRLLLLCLAAGLLGGCNHSSSMNATEAWVASDAAKSPSPAASAPKVKPKAQDSPSKVVSNIAGDRMAVIPTRIQLTRQDETSPFRFTDITQEAGIDFVHFSGMTPEKHFPTANGSGVAIFDYDGDGRMDLYFATATLLPLGTAVKGPNRLYRNLGGGKFQDVTEKSGLGFRGFCHGIIAGDIDNDGDQDVFLCNYGRDVLYLNNGDGTFKDISKEAGVDSPTWSSSGAMLDYDNDGFLDIYVSNYGEWVYPDDANHVGDNEKKVWLYSSPRTIRHTRHHLYHNNKNRTFTDVYSKVITIEKEVEVEENGSKITRKMRVPSPRAEKGDGHGFGVVAADLNDDGLIDLYVANDMNPNYLFLNRGDGTFDDVSEISGAAYDVNGMAQSGMGVDAEDVDGDGLPELFVTNFTNEYATLYHNFGKGVFYDNTAFFGLASDSMPWVKWGCALADFDNDGWPDCFFVNGHVDDNRKQLGQPVEYEEPPMIFRNVEGKRFRLATRDVGPYFEQRHVGRGAAFGDLDDDGDIDIVVNHKDSAPAVLRNDSKNSNHWIRFSLQGTKSNRDGIGARFDIKLNHRLIRRQRKGGVSMESTNDPRVLVGVGQAETIPEVIIRWPSGRISRFENLKVDRTVKVVEPAADAAEAGKTAR